MASRHHSATAPNTNRRKNTTANSKLRLTEIVSVVRRRSYLIWRLIRPFFLVLVLMTVLSRIIIWSCNTVFLGTEISSPERARPRNHQSQDYLMSGIQARRKKRRERTDGLSISNPEPAPSAGLRKFSTTSFTSHHTDKNFCHALPPNTHVLITSMMSSSVALRTIIFLNDCKNVKKIFGVDDLMPNSPARRANLLEHNYKVILKHVSSGKKLVWVDYDELSEYIEYVTHIISLETFQENQSLNTEYNLVVKSWLWHWNNGLSAIQDLLEQKKNNNIVIVYASSHIKSTSKNQCDNNKIIYHATSQMNELIAATYAKLFSTKSIIGIRFPTIYGPYFTAEKSHFNSILMDAIGNKYSESLHNCEIDLMHVDDAAFSIMQALSFSSDNKDVIMDVEVGTVATNSEEISKIFKKYLPPKKQEEIAEAQNQHNVEGEDVDGGDGKVNIHRDSVKQSMTSTSSFDVTITERRVPLNDGIKSVLSYILHRDFPFPYEEHLLPKDYLDDYPELGTDLVLHQDGHQPQYPCACECAHDLNSHQSCSMTFLPMLNSDEGATILKRSKFVTRLCETVVYTISLDGSVLPKEPYLLDETWEKPTENELEGICYMAYVSKTNPVVTDLAPNDDASEIDLWYTKSNGKVQHGIWSLLWFDLPFEEDKKAFTTLLKVAPASFFSPRTKKAMYYNTRQQKKVHKRKRTVSRPPPSPQAVWHMMNNFDVDERAQKYKFLQGGSVGPNQKKWILIQEKEPRRRTAIMLPKYRKKSKISIPSSTLKGGSHKLLMDVLGAHHIGDSLQAQFYSRIMILLNSNFGRRTLPKSVIEGDILPPQRPEYDEENGPFQMHYPDTSFFIIHDLQLHESRRIRCDWYREHLFWTDKGSNVSEELSLGYALARRKVMSGNAYTYKEWVPILADTSNTYGSEDADGSKIDKCNTKGTCNLALDDSHVQLFVRLHDWNQEERMSKYAPVREIFNTIML